MELTQKQLKATAELHLRKGTIDLAKKALDACLKQEKRPGTRLLAAKFALEHARELNKIENPTDNTIVLKVVGKDGKALDI